MKPQKIKGAGLQVRRDQMDALCEQAPESLQFISLAAEQWMGQSVATLTALKRLTDTYPLVCVSHSLSLGGPSDLDKQMLRELRAFIDTQPVALFSEALGWCADDSPLYTTLPIPSTQAAVAWTVSRIAQVQDALGMPIGIRNVVHRMAPVQIEMNEPEFISQVVRESGCHLHLDAVALAHNSWRFGFDVQAYLKALPLKRVNLVCMGQDADVTASQLLASLGSKVAVSFASVKAMQNMQAMEAVC
jgi:uncharacterized protein